MRRCAVVLLVWSGCGEPDPEKVDFIEGVSAHMDLAAARAESRGFFRFPYPSDLRLNEQGGPPLSQVPGVASVPALAAVAETAEELKGYPRMSVGWFAFDGPVAPAAGEDVVLYGPDASVLLVDIDPESPERGQTVPVVARTLTEDHYLDQPVLAVAPVPGWVLRPDNAYAYLVLRSWGTPEGEPLGASARVLQPLQGRNPGGAFGEELVVAAGGVAAVLGALDLQPEDVAAWTSFTTGDAVAQMFEFSEAVRQQEAPRIEALAPFDRDEATPGYCELHGELEVPEFQAGDPPYNTGGRFVVDEEGLPVAQRRPRLPVVVTLPDAPMPPEGFPLAMYYHGSGGVSDQLVARGPQPRGGVPEVGKGPAWVLAQAGYAASGIAHPVNPERVPGASAIAYLNFQNLSAFRDTFRQGVIEQRLYLDALLDLQIDPDLVAEACPGLSVPDDASAIFFDAETVVAIGQSMGGMYVNMVGAVEPRIKAAVPTGAGGHWTRFILLTSLLGEGVVEPLLGGLLRLEPPLTWMHPALHIPQTAWEPAEPVAYTPRLARRPLPGHPVRPIYQPVGLGDSYFPPAVFDAITLAFGNEQAGEQVWPSMQAWLALAGRDGLVDYPVSDNRESEDGTPWTGVVVQYEGDGFSDPHAIYVQLDEVMHQYRCFLQTWRENGVAVVPEGGAVDDPCP